ncbi:cytochrome P450 4C1-like [Dermacentor albipictus]|uniref:cytochrome P450 4C1-like n=1 Tax=Dermacentor albipictus TaxID=60249 RepID=UPI0038FD2DA1
MDHMTDYNDITKAYCLARRTLPPQHPRLSRAEVVLLRQLQTGSLPSPGLIHRMYPETYPTDKCRVCRRETADYTHILWDCIKNPEEARSRAIPPWIEATVKSYDQDQRLWTVQQVLGALEAQGPSEPTTAWRDLTRPLRLFRFTDFRPWLLLAIAVCAFVFLLALGWRRYRVFRRQMNLLKDMPKDSGHYIASGISKVLAVLRNPMDPAVVMYEGFNGFAELTSQEGIFHFWIGMQPCVGIFNEQTRVLVQKIRDSSHLDFVDLFPMMTHFTLDVLCESSMGIQLGAQGTSQHNYFKNLHTLLNCGMERLSKPWLWWNTAYNLSRQKRKFTRAAKDLNNFVNEVIRKRKEILRQEKNGDKKDQTYKYSKAFLDVLLRHHLQDSTLSEDDIMEEVNTFLFAGHETTAVGLTYLLYILGLHQDVQDKVVDEINSIFQGNLERDVTREDASLMKYLECVIKESQRIFTILPIYGRKIEEDFQVGKYVVPRGSTCVILGQILHKDPTYFPDPNVFDPDRFLPENSKGRHPYAFLPFSAGPRNCVGQKFAMTEEKVVVATVLRHFCITSLDHRDQLILAPQPILHPRSVFGGIRVKFTPRRTLQLHNA